MRYRALRNSAGTAAIHRTSIKVDIRAFRFPFVTKHYCGMPMAAFHIVDSNSLERLTGALFGQGHPIKNLKSLLNICKRLRIGLKLLSQRSCAAISYFASSLLTGSQSRPGGWLANALARLRNSADGLSTSATRPKQSAAASNSRRRQYTRPSA
jgi:hypothetical protein